MSDYLKTLTVLQDVPLALVCVSPSVTVSMVITSESVALLPRACHRSRSPWSIIASHQTCFDTHTNKHANTLTPQGHTWNPLSGKVRSAYTD